MRLVLLTTIALASAPLRVDAALHTVIVGARGELVYEPATLAIRAGDSVRFVNVFGFHNVVADDDSFRCANGCDGQGGSGAPSSALWTATVVFAQPGTVGYYCEAHGAPGSGMVGTIVVESTPVTLQSFDVE